MKLLASLTLLLILFAAACSHSNNATSAPPTTVEEAPEDHWHIPIGFYVCGEFLSYPDSLQPHPPSANSSITIQDGVLHISPTPDTAPDLSFTLNDVAIQTGFRLTDEELIFSSQQDAQFSEAIGCGGEPAILNVIRWQLKGTNTSPILPPESFSQNLSSIALRSNLEAYVIALLPAGSPTPPIPLSTLKLLALPEVQELTNVPSPEKLQLIPSRVAPAPAGETLTGAVGCPAQNNTQRVTQFLNLATLPICIDVEQTYTALFETNLGNVEVVLDNASLNATNAFVFLAGYKYYDGSALFRTDPIQGLIQGGATLTNLVDDPGPGFRILDDDGDFTYTAGQLIMARNESPNSATGQFIFTASNAANRLGASELTNNLVVFGEVTEGLDILRKILSHHAEDPSAPPSTSRFLGGPIIPVVIERVTVTSSSS